MGKQVSGLYGQTQSQLVAADVLPSALGGNGAGSFAIWSGLDALKRQVEMTTALELCMLALRNVESVVNAEIVAYMIVGGSKSSVIVIDDVAAIPTLSTTHVAVIADAGFLGGIAARTLPLRTTFREMMSVFKFTHMTTA